MADKGSIHVETINSENHMILDCSNVDISGELNVQRDVSINGRLDVQGDVNVGNLLKFDTGSLWGDLINIRGGLSSEYGYQTMVSHNYHQETFRPQLEFKFGYVDHPDGGTTVSRSCYITYNGLHVDKIEPQDPNLNLPLDVNGNLRIGTVDGGNIYWLKGAGYADRISIRGIYFGASPPYEGNYKLEFRVRSFPNAPAMYLQRNGGGNPFLRVNGQSSFGSDDRLKHNEVNLVNALDTINKLQPKVYDKTAEMLDENYNGPLEEGTYNKEVGFIAQEVYEINELKEFVDVGDETEPWGINYNALFSYNIGATQELHSLFQAQEIKISNLETENTLLKAENSLIKSKLNEILSEMGKETI